MLDEKTLTKLVPPHPTPGKPSSCLLASQGDLGHGGGGQDIAKRPHLHAPLCQYRWNESEAWDGLVRGENVFSCEIKRGSS